MVIGTVVGALLHALFWIVTLPFRIVFKLLFGLGGCCSASSGAVVAVVARHAVACRRICRC
jgi:hypothetical protein